MLVSIIKYIKHYYNNGLLNSSLLRLRLRFDKTLFAKTVIWRGDICKIKIGDRTSVGNYSVLVVAPSPSGKEGRLTVGNDTYIGEFNNIRAAGGEITIGNGCLISQHITIVSSNHLLQRNMPLIKQDWSASNNFVHIEDDVWVGANSVILPGVTIHKGAVVAAGSIVTKDIPEYAIVAGNPAKILKYRE